MNIAYALGRIFVPIVFIWEAILKLINIGRFAKLLADSKVPMPDEIAVIFCLGSAGRINARVGGLTHEEAEAKMKAKASN